jgi:hypothetical protein
MSIKYIALPIVIVSFFAVIEWIKNNARFMDINSQITPLGVSAILALVVTVTAVVAAVGLSFISSGESTFAQNVIYKAAFFLGLWGIISAFGIEVILDIPFLGTIFWVFLTIFYILGVQEQIGTHPSG